MTTATKVKREDVLRLKVSPDIKSRLDRLSGVFGMPPSTLAAYAVAQWVGQQEQGTRVAEAVAKEIGGQAGSALQKLIEMLEAQGKLDL